MSDGRRVVVRSQDGTSYEPLTGQLVLYLEVKTLRDDVVRVLRPSAGRERRALRMSCICAQVSWTKTPPRWPRPPTFTKKHTD